VWGVALSGEVLEGEFELADHKISYASGTSIARWPEGGVVIARDLNDQGIGKYKIAHTSHMIGHNTQN
jgi:membrane-bound transcription factor site-1 protease